MAADVNSAPDAEAPEDRPCLRVAGGAFLLVKESPSQWSLMRLSSAMNSEDPTTGMGAMYDFIMRLVAPEERARLDAHLDKAGDLTASDLDSAIGNALVELSGRGKAPAPAKLDSSPPASGGTSTTPVGSRRVSLSRGTVHPLGATAADLATGSGPSTS